MRQDIWVRKGDIEAAGENLVDVLSTGTVSVQIGLFSTGATLYMSEDDATTIANRILDAVRAANGIDDLAVTVKTCDHCETPIAVDNEGEYIHLDNKGRKEYYACRHYADLIDTDAMATFHGTTTAPVAS